MSRTYREFGDLLSAYNEADEKWTPIQKAHEFLDSVNEDEIWEQRHAAADALFTYIAELEAENTALKQHPQPIEFWSDEKKQIYKINERRTVKSGNEEREE